MHTLRGRNSATGKGAIQTAQRGANGIHRLTGLYFFALLQIGGIALVNLQNGKVIHLAEINDLTDGIVAAVHIHRDLLRAFDHMVVGNQRSFTVDKKAGTDAVIRIHRHRARAHVLGQFNGCIFLLLGFGNHLNLRLAGGFGRGRSLRRFGAAARQQRQSHGHNHQKDDTPLF